MGQPEHDTEDKLQTLPHRSSPTAAATHTRRNAIALLGAGCLAGVLGVPTTVRAAVRSSSEPDTIVAEAPVVLVGTVVRTSSSDVTLSTSSGTVVITPAAGARMYSGARGRVTSPVDFVVGDRLFVTGAPGAAGAVLASALGSVYQPIEFEVLSASGSSRQVTTSVGTLDLTGALPDIGNIQRTFAAGQKLSGDSWTDPRTGQRFLMLTDADRRA